MNHRERSRLALHRAVTVEAPARVHLGFMDLNGDLGRKYGSVGLALDPIATRVRLTPADSFCATGPDGERGLRCVRMLHERMGLAGALALVIETAIPAHEGLGSGTQLALAVGTAIDRLYGLGLGSRQIAQVLNRGARSGIGIGAFDHGGFLVDSGRGEADALPPVTVRLEFPAEWRLLLIQERQGRGLHGVQETTAFGALPLFPAAQAAHLCRLVLMQVLPALTERDYAQFGEGIGELQRVVGDHFAPAQGGRFTSERVAAVLEWLREKGIAGIGQSSWGPTGFAVIDNEPRAQALAEELKARFGEQSLRFQALPARNRGATVVVDDRVPRETVKV